MGKLLLIILFVLILLMILTVALYQWLGWSGLLVAIGLLVLLAWCIKFVASRLIYRLFLAPFEAKGAVLANAQTRVHSITPAPAPPIDEQENEAEERPEDMDDEEWAQLQDEEEEERRIARARRYCYIDVTVTPAAPSGRGFTMWEPSDITLVKSDSKNGLTDDQEAGTIENVKIWNEGEWHDDEGMKYAGPQRLQIHAGIDPGITHARFSYYLEVFGDVNFDTASLENLNGLE